ncbi:hypothetical protein C7122_00105 [Lachnospiraceae bacterium oral taxon 096]|nr:hypothetical protein C7122_00105 [Lachnospiraceae bacterium oral taxon 096]QUI96260.1 restriction endonuclease subunit S [Lachnospiraceae bacterium oral taxon 096]
MNKRWVKFPEVLFFQEGPGVRNTQYTSEGVKLLNVANLVNGKVDISNSDRFISRDEAYGKYKHFLCDNGDFIVASSGIKVEYIDKKMGFIDKSMLPLCMNTSTIRFKVLNSKELNIRYFMYYLKSRHFKLQLAKQITGSAQLNYGPSHLKDMCIPIVDIYIQNNIVEILDKIQNIIDTYEVKIEKLDILVKARFVEMFGGRGKVVLLTNYVWFQEGPGVRSVDFAVEGINLLTGSNINDNELSFGYKSDRFISNELANGKYAHFMCDKDDILVVSSAIAPEKFDQKVAIVEEDKKYCLNTGIIRFKPNREVMTLGYFREFLKTDYFKHQVMAEMRGIAQMHFGPSHLKQMTILLPESMEQQIEFEKFITQVNKSKVEVKKALDEAQLLFDSLMQKYFG